MQMMVQMKGQVVLLVVHMMDDLVLVEVHKRPSVRMMAVASMKMMAKMMAALQCDHYTSSAMPKLLIVNTLVFVEKSSTDLQMNCENLDHLTLDHSEMMMMIVSVELAAALAVVAMNKIMAFEIADGEMADFAPKIDQIFHFHMLSLELLEPKFSCHIIIIT